MNKNRIMVLSLAAFAACLIGYVSLTLLAVATGMTLLTVLMISALRTAHDSDTALALNVKHTRTS